MELLNEFMFTTIPFIALLSNIFLLFTLISAKKDSSIHAFMGLLVCFIMWTGGAYFMRLQLYPGVSFWWMVSLTALFAVPYMYYLLVASYTEQKGYFLKILWGLGTAVLILLNWCNVFMTNPEITYVNGKLVSNYAIKWPAVFVVFFALAVFVSIGHTVKTTIKEERIVTIYLRPLLIGIVIMMVGVFLNTLPGLTTLPTDTLGCALNAVCIYYAFYKKRFYALSQLTSKGAMYLISLLLTALALVPIYEQAEKFLQEHFSRHIDNIPMAITIVCSGIAILLFLMLNSLHDGLYVREQQRKETRVKEFSVSVNTTLKTSDILKKFSDLVKEEIEVDHLYLCTYSEDAKSYSSDPNIGSLEQRLTFKEDHPLVQTMNRAKGGVLYSDFQRSTIYKGMWEQEKELLNRLELSYLLPFEGKERALGFALFSKKSGKGDFSYHEVTFLESVASIAAIALQNAHLYQVLEREAELDPMTGLLNRRAYNRRVDYQFTEKKASPITMILFNLDDFSLYNELFGNEEGDQMLVQFSEILLSVFGTRGIVARYGGKEFAVLLPYCDAQTAKDYAERVKQKLIEKIESGTEKTKSFLSFSAGIASYPGHAASASQLMTYSNMVVFQIKQHGKNRIEIYDDQKSYSGEEQEPIQELAPTIYALTAAIDAKDHYTFNHSNSVSNYAAMLAEHAGIAKNHVEIIRQAGLLHDIGKIGIPDAILTKKGRLSNEEFSVIRQHVERSIEMIRHLSSLDYVIPAVLCHHERFDGKGYPRGIAGEDIPIGARCLSIADSFDAMISKRSYKDRMEVGDALAEIEKNLGTQFDPVLGRKFIDLVKDGTIEVVYY